MFIYVLDLDDAIMHGKLSFLVSDPQELQQQML